MNISLSFIFPNKFIFALVYLLVFRVYLAVVVAVAALKMFHPNVRQLNIVPPMINSHRLMKPFHQNDRPSKGTKIFHWWFISPSFVSSSSSADDPRHEVYGWSVSSRASETATNVPVPIHCRPIFNTDDQTQVKHSLRMIDFFHCILQRFGVPWALIWLDRLRHRTIHWINN